MTDEEMAAFLNLPVEFVGKLPPGKRALFERMATVEIEVALWQEGLGPKPAGVLVDYPRSPRRRRRRV